MTVTVNHSSPREFASGTIPASTTITVGAAGSPMPATLYLTSTDAAREIAISTDGTNFFVPSYDASPTAFISVAILAPIQKVRFTGALADAWGIR
jgi:hypothetical protein